MGVHSTGKPYTLLHVGKTEEKSVNLQSCLVMNTRIFCQEQHNFSSDLHLGQRKLGQMFIQTAIKEGLLQHISLGMAPKANLTTQ